MLYFTLKKTAEGAAKPRFTIFISSNENLVQRINPDSKVHAEDVTMDALIKYMEESYARYERVLVVNNKRDASAVIDLCVDCKTNILVTNPTELFTTTNLTNSADKELFKNQFKPVDEIDLELISKLLVDLIPVRLTRDEVVAKILDSNQDLDRHNVEMVVDAAYEKIVTRVRDSKSLNHVNSIEIESVREAYDYINSLERGVVVLQAPTGSGKTGCVTTPLIAQSIEDKEKVAHISHRRSIAANQGLSGIAGLRHYGSVEPGDEHDVQALNLVVNSSIRKNLLPALSGLRNLVVDEAQQTLNHVIVGSVDNRVAVFEKLKDVLKHSERVVLSDADASATLLDFVTKCGRNDITVIKLARSHSDIEMQIADYAMTLDRLYRAISANETCVVAIDNKKAASAISLKIQKLDSTKKSLLITSDTVDGDAQQAFIKNPNSESLNYDVVIFSPVITSNLSITNEHFTRVFGLFGGVLPPAETIQMLRRIRTARCLEVGLKGAIKRDFGGEHEGVIKKRLQKAAEANHLGVATDVDVDIEDLKNEDFIEITAKIKAQNQFLINHFIPAFVINAQIDGFRVSIEPFSEVESKRGKSLARSGDLMEQAVYRESLYRLIKKSEGAAPEADAAEGNEGNAYYVAELEKIRDVLATDNLGDMELQLWGRGRNLPEQIMNLEIARMTDEELSVFDEEDSRFSPLERQYPLARRAIFDLFSHTLNIDFDTGECNFTQSDASSLRDAICARQDLFNLISQRKVTSKWLELEYPVREINKLIVQFFNLRVSSSQKRNDSRTYTIGSESFNQMNEIVQRRANRDIAIRNE